MDPEAIINMLLMGAEDDKTAVKRQIDEAMTNYSTSKLSLSGCEEVYPLIPIKIEPDLNSDEEDISSTQDTQPAFYPEDEKSHLSKSLVEEEPALRSLFVKISNISKYLLTAQQDMESITAGFSVDLENIKDLLKNGFLDEDVPLCGSDDGECEYVEDGQFKHEDDIYSDDFKVDDDDSHRDDDEDKDYQVEEDEEFSESSVKNLETIYEDYNHNIEDDDWKPHWGNKGSLSSKGTWCYKVNLTKSDEYTGKVGGLAAEVPAKRSGNMLKETTLACQSTVLGKPSNQSGPEKGSSSENVGDTFLGRRNKFDDNADLAASRGTSPRFGKCEISEEIPGPDGSIPARTTSPILSVISDVSKVSKIFLRSCATEKKADWGNDCGDTVTAIKKSERNNSGSQAKAGLKKSFQCSVCGKVYSKKSTLKIHKRIHTGERPYKCDICGKSFMKGYNLKTHQQRHSEERPFKCLVCEKRFQTKSGLAAHQLVHSDERPHKCHICGLAYKQRAGLKKHEKIVHERAGAISCLVCRIIFRSTEELNSHKRIHLPQKRQECKYCEKQLLTRNLLSHEKRCSLPKNFRCEICDFSCKVQSYLTVHMRRHTGEKPYLCQMCGKSWVSISELTMHKKTHSDQRPHNCLFCEKSFRRNSHLRRHEKIHTGEKSYKCQFCPESFITLDSKVYHEKRKHLGIKDYGRSKTPYSDMPKRHKCSFCDQTFVMSGERNVHERERHTGLKPFSCNICGKKFSRKTRAKSHELKMHRERSSVKKADGETLRKTFRPQRKRRYCLNHRK